ncbi:MAG: hypothetical protein GZ085_08230 [Sulfuriferula multivorans]|uniref:MSHA biogenesis protein MshK n=1 Tax=Sulfuriferula multivorans TaxID=1559896 RepID=A0A7C9NZR4_9PROT|nr:hypothetical protein [Sulfuriferula multivorans]
MATRMMLFVLMALLLPAAAATSLPDPTALPKAMTSPGTEALQEAPALDWVKLNGKHSIAWYGGSIVKLGESVEGGRVTAIHEDHIVISGKGGRRVIYLLDKSTRTQLLAPPRPTRKTRN